MRQEILFDLCKDQLQRLHKATEALRNAGYDSISSYLDDLLEFDLVHHVDRYRMSIALLTIGEHNGNLVQGKEFRRLLYKYTFQVANEEMDRLVENPTLRLPASEVSPEALDSFDIKAIARCQNQIALFITSILRSTVGMTDAFKNNKFDEVEVVEEVELGDATAHQTKLPLRSRNRLLIATVSLCMLSYARSVRSNVLQTMMGYFAFADNTTKRMMEFYIVVLQSRMDPRLSGWHFQIRPLCIQIYSFNSGP